MTLEEIAKQLKKVKSAAIFCHMRPDGDALGAALGLSWMLGRHGAKCTVVCESDIPSKFDFMEGMDTVCKIPPSDVEVYIAVDSSDEHRLGALCDTFVSAKKPKFNIDHHISNTRYGNYCYIEDCSATCEIMARLADCLGVELSPLAANYILMGLSSDTGNFAHQNVTEQTFLAAAKLVACGGDIHRIQYNMFKKQSAARALLFGRTMSNIRYFEDGKIAIISISAEQLKACGATSDMTEGFIDFPLSVDGVEVAACLLETGKDRFKVSLRSKGKTDVNAVASVYGGGGHILASGCMINGCLEEAVDKLRYTIKQHIEL